MTFFIINNIIFNTTFILIHFFIFIVMTVHSIFRIVYNMLIVINNILT